MEDNEKMLIDALENAECNDPFECPFGMFGKNKDGNWGCFAKYPNGDPNEENQGCIAQQAAKLLKDRQTENICHLRDTRIFSCSKCGYGLDDLYLVNEHDYPIEPVYCPNCGRKVVE